MTFTSRVTRLKSLKYTYSWWPSHLLKCVFSGIRLIAVAKQLGKALKFWRKKPAIQIAVVQTQAMNSRWLGSEKEVSDLLERFGSYSGSQTACFRAKTIQMFTLFFSSEGEDIVLHDISPMEHIIVFIFHFLHSISSHLVKRTSRLRRACVTFIW